MPRSRIERIREKIRLRQYDMSAHKVEEMAEDELDMIDVETAIGNGRITRTEKDDLRGPKYVVEGIGLRPTEISWSSRTLHQRWPLSIITVYEITHD
jgi:hypothetical protein